MSDRLDKISGKVFTDVKSESWFPKNFYRTESLFTSKSITIWWPSDRRAGLRYIDISFIFPIWMLRPCFTL